MHGSRTMVGPRHQRVVDYDVVVVGARCAGAATAMLLAQRGARVLVVDRTAEKLHAFVQQRDDALRLHPLRESGEPTDVREEHRDQTVLASELDVTLEELFGDVLGDDLVQHGAIALAEGQPARHVVERVGQGSHLVARGHADLSSEIARGHSSRRSDE